MVSVQLHIIQPNHPLIKDIHYSFSVDNENIDEIKHKLYDYSNITENEAININMTFPQSGKLKDAYPRMCFEPESSYFYKGTRLSQEIFIAIKQSSENKWEALLLN